MANLEILIKAINSGSPPYSIREMTDLYNETWCAEQINANPTLLAPKTVTEITIRRLVYKAVRDGVLFETPRTIKGVLYNTKPYFYVMKDGNKKTGEASIPVANGQVTPSEFINLFLVGQLSKTTAFNKSEWDKIRTIFIRLVLSTDPECGVAIDLEGWSNTIEDFRDRIVSMLHIVNSILGSELWNPKFREFIAGQFSNGELIEEKLRQWERECYE